MGEELKPCPFCGRTASISQSFKASVRVKNEELHYQVKCSFCSAQSGWADNKQFLVDWWNGKHNPDTRAALKKAMEILLTDDEEAKAELFLELKGYL